MGDNVSGSSSDGIVLVAPVPREPEPLLLNQMENETKELVINIPKDLEPASWPECCIYKVPRKLRKINKTAYTPQFVSIGPLHHGNKSLQAMEKQKLRYLVYFCNRTGKTKDQLANQIREREVKIRHCYEDSFELTSDEFVKMMLLDSVFIVELFLRKHEMKEDFILRRPWLRIGVVLDLILLENQVPYFLLEDIYNFAFPDFDRRDPNTFYELACNLPFKYMCRPRIIGGEEGSGQKCACDFFSFLSCFWVTKCFSCRNCKQPNVRQEELQERSHNFQQLVSKFEKEKPKHFIDIIRKFRSYNAPEPKHHDIIKNRYNATKLHHAGAKFKVDPTAWPLDVKFERGILRMPIFYVEDGTERFIRNLMALEQCHYPYHACICDYIMLLDSLINTEKDVDILIQSGVIKNLLGNDQAVADLMNNLGNEIVTTEFCFSELCHDLNQHYENCWYRSVAVMRSVYFNNLWRGTGTIAALILLFLYNLSTLSCKFCDLVESSCACFFLLFQLRNVFTRDVWCVSHV